MIACPMKRKRFSRHCSSDLPGRPEPGPDSKSLAVPRCPIHGFPAAEVNPSIACDLPPIGGPILARDAFLLQRAQETAQNYLPFEALLKQHEELFGEKLELPTKEQQDV